VKPIKVRGKEVKVNFWDLAGGEEYAEIRNEFYKDAQGVRLARGATPSAHADGWSLLLKATCP